MIARAIRCVAQLAWFAALVSIGCRDIYVCRGGALCEAVNAGSGTAALGGSDSDGMSATRGGTAGASGASSHTGGTSGMPSAGRTETPNEAGAAGDESCQIPLANCDQTGLNGCETDVSVAIDHCGACNQPCAGVCASSACHVPIAVTKQAIRALSPFAVTSDYLYFMWGDEGGPYRLSRVDKTGGTPQIVADNLPPLSKIAAGPDRIYLWDFAENLRSVTPAGVVTDEGFGVSAVAAQTSGVYAVRDAALIERELGSTTWQPARQLAKSEPGVDLWPVDVGGHLVVLRTTTRFGEVARYEVLLVDQDGTSDAEPQTLAAGTGELVQVRGSRTHIYWLTRGTTDSYSFELRRHDLYLDSSEELVAKERNVLGFAVDEGYAYLPRSLNTGHELELVLLDSRAEKYHFGTRPELTYPESVADFLWFFDTSKQRLMRVELWTIESP